MSEKAYDLDTKGLDQIIKAFKKFPTIRVGILGDGSERVGTDGEKSGLSNASVGLIHEAGSVNSPQRSFLRIPLATQFDKRLAAAGALDRAILRRMVRTGSALGLAKKLGVMAEGVVLEAFDTRGFGEWKPSDMRFKKVHQTLVETNQLRDSITHEIEEN